jgi:hypothetical protein
MWREIRFKTRMVFAVLFLFADLIAQDIHSSTSIYINLDAEIHVGGNLENKGLLLNNGAISIDGNWSNAFVYQGLGRVLLNGFNQSIDNNQQSIHALEIYGGGVKSLVGTTMVTGKLTLEDGIVSLSEPSTLVLTETATIAGGSNLSFVDGSITSRGNGYKYFPIGAHSKFYPIEFIDVKGINPSIEVTVMENYPFDVTPNIRKNVYWLRKTTSGSFDGSQISIAFDATEYPDPEKIAIAQGDAANKPIVIDNDEFDVEYGTVNKVTSKRELKGGIFMLGEGPLPPPKAFFISTALSPRAAFSENKTVRVFGEMLNETNFTFKVFNRAGTILFETNSLPAMRETGWDGRDPVTGDYLAAGAYPFLLQGIQVDGKKMVKQGVITIVH